MAESASVAPSSTPLPSTAANATVPAGGGGATVTPIGKPHHSAAQPRDEAKRFAGPPTQAEQKPPDAPRVLKAGGREIPEEEALALLEDKMETQRLSRAEAEELARLRSEALKWREPHKALTPQQRQAIAYAELKEWEQREAEKNLPPEQQAFLQQRREFARQQEAFRQQQEAEQAKRTEAANAQLEQHCKANIMATFEALGEEARPGLMFREVAREWAESSAAGRNDTPRAVALRVRQRMDALAESRAVARGPKALLSHPKMAAALNAMKPEEVAEFFEALGPFMETVRAANLQKRGLVPVPSAQQFPGQDTGGTTPEALANAPEPRTTQGWQQFFRNGGKPDTPSRHAAYWKLRDANAL